MINYRHLYFDDLDITKPQTTVGIKITVGSAEIKWANTTGDLGGEPETLDCTPLSASVQLNKTGIQSLDNWTVDYYFNDDDFQTLEDQKKAAEQVEITVSLPNGAKFTNKGKCTANYATGVAVNGMLTGHAVFELSSPDGWTYTKSTTNSAGG
jgi:hypothetical protein